MVNEITPTYYAGGSQQLTYTLTGSGFNILPNDVFGIRADRNNNPLEHIDSVSTGYLYSITEKSDTRMVLTCLYTSALARGGYLGGIVSNDRNFVYWVNNSQPLPPTRGDIVEPEFIDER